MRLMGSVTGKIKASGSKENMKSPVSQTKEFIKYQKISTEFDVTNSTPQSCSEYSNFINQKSDSFSNLICAWNKVSNKKYNEKTLTNHLSLSKTTWPIPFFESLFLPEFKIRDDIKEDKFLILEAISSGAFSKVFKVIKKDDNKIFAMKIMSKAQIVSNNLINQVKQEVKIQKVIGHNPFIVSCPYHWQSRKQLFIISEYVSGGELFKLVEKKHGLPLEILKLYVAELALALDFLHNAGIIYRDLKLENILLSEKGHIQLIDFGLSKWLKYGMRTNTICGTLQYIAPEILQKKSYNHAVDWWSLGIVLVYLSSGQCPFESCLDEEGVCRSVPEMVCPSEVRDLANRLLVEDPLRRLRSLAALKRTALFMKYDFDKILDYTVDLNDLTICEVQRQ